MKRLISTLAIILLTLAGLTAYAQDTTAVAVTPNSKAPNMDKIKDFADSRKYNKLMKRYESNDPSLSLDEYRNIYYGFVFQEQYRPYDKTNYGKRISTLYYKDNLSRVDCDTIIKYAELSLKEDPFNLQQMNYLIYAYKTKKKYHLAQHWQTRLNNVLRAILSTGTGNNINDAWHVISIDHEYALINFINPNFVVDHQEFIEPYFDYIILKKLSGNVPDGFYFNIKYPLDNYNSRFPNQK